MTNTTSDFLTDYPDAPIHEAEPILTEKERQKNNWFWIKVCWGIFCIETIIVVISINK